MLFLFNKVRCLDTSMEIMNTRLKKHIIYKPENLTGLAKKCDWFINGNQLLKLNTRQPKTIFLTAYRGNAGIKHLVTKLLSQINSAFVLIIASEDYTFPTGKGDIRKNIYRYCKNLLYELLDFRFLAHIFVENLDIIHHKMSPIPLGLLKGKKITNEEFLAIDFSKKTHLCFVRNRTYGNVDGQWADRKRANDYAKKDWSNFVKYIDYEMKQDNYIKTLKQSKFCLCIHGGGYDPCPKFFESILCGTIPIIQHSPLDFAFEKYPCVFIDDLNKNALTAEFLLQKYEELKEFYEGEKRKTILPLLTLDYWWNIIVSKLNNFVPCEVNLINNPMYEKLYFDENLESCFRTREKLLRKPI